MLLPFPLSTDAPAGPARRNEGLSGQLSTNDNFLRTDLIDTETQSISQATGAGQLSRPTTLDVWIAALDLVQDTATLPRFDGETRLPHASPKYAGSETAVPIPQAFKTDAAGHSLPVPEEPLDWIASLLDATKDITTGSSATGVPAWLSDALTQLPAPPETPLATLETSSAKPETTGPLIAPKPTNGPSAPVNLTADAQIDILPLSSTAAVASEIPMALTAPTGDVEARTAGNDRAGRVESKPNEPTLLSDMPIPIRKEGQATTTETAPVPISEKIAVAENAISTDNAKAARAGNEPGGAPSASIVSTWSPVILNGTGGPPPLQEAVSGTDGAKPAIRQAIHRSPLAPHPGDSAPLPARPEVVLGATASTAPPNTDKGQTITSIEADRPRAAETLALPSKAHETAPEQSNFPALDRRAPGNFSASEQATSVTDPAHSVSERPLALLQGNMSTPSTEVLPKPVPLPQLQSTVTEQVTLLSKQLTVHPELDAPKAPTSRTVELELAPADLGRLRLVLHTTERGLHLAVSIERPEMLETVRRHLDSLHRSLISEGVTLDSVDIGTGGRRHPNDNQTGQADLERVARHMPEDSALPADAAAASPVHLPDGRLDLSL